MIKEALPYKIDRFLPIFKFRVCGICGREFLLHWLWRLQLLTRHGYTTRYICPECHTTREEIERLAELIIKGTGPGVGSRKGDNVESRSVVKDEKRK